MWPLKCARLTKIISFHLHVSFPGIIKLPGTLTPMKRTHGVNVFKCLVY